MEGGRNVDRTVSRFIRYAECTSESHNEEAFCEYTEQELAGTGIPLECQKLGNEVVTDDWNVPVRIPGRSGKAPFLFIFHLDTVAPNNQVGICVGGGYIRSKGSNVLGANGKPTIAVVTGVAERLIQEGEINRPIELLFTVCQELGLHGTKCTGYSGVESKEAIAIDHYVTGEVLTRTPARLYINVELIGRATHIIRNEELRVNILLTAVKIIHQIPVGRLNDNLSVSVFDLVPLSPSNAVPKYARLDVEIRYFGNDIKQEIRGRIRRKAGEAAERIGRECGIREGEDVPETDFSENTDTLERLASIYSRSGLSVIPTRSFGVLGATCTNQLGIRTVLIDFSIYHPHSAREYVVVENVKEMLELVENIIHYF